MGEHVSVAGKPRRVKEIVTTLWSVVPTPRLRLLGSGCTWEITEGPMAKYPSAVCTLRHLAER